jgi:hypothetical protein
LTLNANCLHFQEKIRIPIYNVSEVVDTIDNKQITSNISKIIISGREEKIKKFFREVTFEQLVRNDSGSIPKSFRKLNTNDKVSRTIWILEEIKKRDTELRNYIYTELLKVEYGKPSMLLNHMINNYFVNFDEEDTTLMDKIRKLQSKMNR